MDPSRHAASKNNESHQPKMPPDNATIAGPATPRLSRVPALATSALLHAAHLPQTVPSTTARSNPRRAWEEENDGIRIAI